MANIKDTLIIKHLSNDLTVDEKEELLRHFGATEVKCIVSKHKKCNPVFARFSSPAAATVALKRLHQLNVLGYPLAVEYARHEVVFDGTSTISYKTEEEELKDEIRKKHREYVQKLRSWHECLQPGRPPPSHLQYKYPPANLDILTNICRTLVTVPEFYTQVLHLMNRMNLPCPFGSLFPGPKLYVAIQQSDIPPTEESKEIEDDEEIWEEEMDVSESEIEDDEEDKSRFPEVIPVLPAKRRATRSKILVKRKRTFVGNPSAKAVLPSSGKAPMLPEEVFERETLSQPKKIELHIAGHSATANNEKDENPVPQETEELPGFGTIEPTKDATRETNEEEEPGETETFDGSVISLKELRSNRISSKDFGVLPVFKNYQSGAPSCRLYVKNIAKQVTERDLHYIFRSFLNLKNEEDIKMFDIRLMQEGRMKGQAFITFPSINQAQKALKETNGYILKNKPLVVQFARSAKPK